MVVSTGKFAPRARTVGAVPVILLTRFQLPVLALIAIPILHGVVEVIGSMFVGAVVAVSFSPTNARIPVARVSSLNLATAVKPELRLHSKLFTRVEASPPAVATLIFCPLRVRVHRLVSAIAGCDIVPTLAIAFPVTSNAAALPACICWNVLKKE